MGSCKNYLEAHIARFEGSCQGVQTSSINRTF